MNFIDQRTPFERTLLAWELLKACEEARRGKFSIPTWFKVHNGKIEHYDSFEARFQAVVIAIIKSKALVKNIFDSQFTLQWTNRIALHPESETACKEENAETNRLRNNQVNFASKNGGPGRKNNADQKPFSTGRMAKRQRVDSAAPTESSTQVIASHPAADHPVPQGQKLIAAFNVRLPQSNLPTAQNLHARVPQDDGFWDQAVEYPEPQKAFHFGDTFESQIAHGSNSHDFVAPSVESTPSFSYQQRVHVHPSLAEQSAQGINFSAHNSWNSASTAGLVLRECRSSRVTLRTISPTAGHRQYGSAGPRCETHNILEMAQSAKSFAEETTEREIPHVGPTSAWQHVS